MMPKWSEALAHHVQGKGTHTKRYVRIVGLYDASANIVLYLTFISQLGYIAENFLNR